MTYLISPLDAEGQSSPPAPSIFDAFTLINEALIQTADFVIFSDANDGNKYKSRNKVGVVTVGSTDCGQVIQDAILANPSRTNSAIIHIDSSVDADITDRTGVRSQVAGIHLASNTMLINDGKLTCDAGGTGNLMQNDNLDNGGSRDTNIFIGGRGTYDGGVAAAGVNPKMPIAVKYMDGFSVRDAKFQNSGTHNCSIKSCTEVRVQDARFFNSGDDNISCLNSQDVWIKNNYCDTTRSDFGAVTSSNIECEVEEAATSDYIVTGNICINSDSDGIHCVTDPGDFNPMARMIVTGNIVRDCGTAGIDFFSGEATNYMVTGVMSNNIVENAGTSAYKIGRARHVTCNGNVAVASGTYGLLIADASHVSVNGFDSNGSTLEGILISDSSSIALSNVATTNAGTSGAKVHAVRVQDSDNVKLSQPTMIDDRALVGTGMQSAVRFNSCTGHLVVTGLTGDGLTAGTGTGITVSGSSVVGNNGTDIDTTNVATAAV